MDATNNVGKEERFRVGQIDFQCVSLLEKCSKVVKQGGPRPVDDSTWQCNGEDDPN